MMTSTYLGGPERQGWQWWCWIAPRNPLHGAETNSKDVPLTDQRDRTQHQYVATRLHGGTQWWNLVFPVFNEKRGVQSHERQRNEKPMPCQQEARWSIWMALAMHLRFHPLSPCPEEALPDSAQWPADRSRQNGKGPWDFALLKHLKKKGLVWMFECDKLW